MADNFQNLYNPNGVPIVSPYLTQQLQNRTPLPQPIGSTYNLTTASEIYNVPAGNNNTSVGICLNELVMYLKSYQNGYPVIVGYRLTPLDAATNTPSTSTNEAPRNEELNTNIKELIKKLDSIQPRQPIKKEATEWQI